MNYELAIVPPGGGNCERVLFTSFQASVLPGMPGFRLN